jgi:hypothetical protein
MPEKIKVMEMCREVLKEIMAILWYASSVLQISGSKALVSTW